MFEQQFYDRPGLGGTELSQSDWSSKVYIDGDLFIGKRSLFQRVRFDEGLHWDECEDVVLSQRGSLDGVNHPKA